MHEAVLAWVGQFRTTDDLAVLDIGGRDLNGNTRGFFPNASPYTVLDLRPGKGVDIIADAATWDGKVDTFDLATESWTPTKIAYDLVLCTETFEHTEKWREIIATAYAALRPGGWLVFTCAGPGRPEHSGVEAVWGLIGDEWYSNVSAAEIAGELHDQGWTDIEARQLGLDTQGKAVKPLASSEVLFGAELSRTAAGCLGA